MTLNPDTRVINCCYAGDVHYINLKAMLHHECPVTIMSPDDSRAIINHPGVDCVFAGKRAYIGQDSLDRQYEHLKLMLTYPENHFLIHDSDSVMLSPRIPEYLYEHSDIVWSNQVDDGIPEHQGFFPTGWPHVAFQPPYFLNRSTIEKMVAAQESGHPFTKASPCMPFIDFYMVQLTMVAGLRWRRFRDCISCPITLNPITHPIATRTPEVQAGYEERVAMVTASVQHNGCTVLHSVKDPDAVEHFLAAHRDFASGHSPLLREWAPGRVGPVRHESHGKGFGDAASLKA